MKYLLITLILFAIGCNESIAPLAPVIDDNGNTIVEPEKPILDTALIGGWSKNGFDTITFFNDGKYETREDSGKWWVEFNKVFLDGKTKIDAYYNINYDNQSANYLTLYYFDIKENKEVSKTYLRYK